MALEEAQRYAAQMGGWLERCGPCGAGMSHLGAWAADERLDALIQVEVLILDDLGAKYLTAWAQEQLFVLLNARYLTDRATMLTSNDRRAGAADLDADQRLSAVRSAATA